MERKESSVTSGNEVEDPYLMIRMMPELELVESLLVADVGAFSASSYS